MENKNIYIDFILQCFSKGIVERGEVMAKFGEFRQTPSRTFDRYFKTAKEQYSKQRETINKEKLSTTIELEKEAVKRNILTKLESMEVLTQIVYTSEKDIDKISAIKTLSDFEGWNAPKLNANTDSKGNDILPPLFGDFGVVNLENEEKLTN